MDPFLGGSVVVRVLSNSEVLSRLESPEVRSFFKTGIMVSYAGGQGRDEMKRLNAAAIVEGLRSDRGTTRDRGPIWEESYYATATRVFAECLDEVFGPKKGDARG
jgi:hypothetical protein